MRYLIYMRVSTEKQDEEMQRHHCMSYIKSVNTTDAPILSYADPDVSSRVKMENRQGLQEMLLDVQKGDVVVTFKLDRLSRDIIEMVTIHRIIKSKKAQVYSLGEPNIEDWMLGIFASLAQKERENISDRTKAKLAEIKAKGTRLGRVPYGQRLNEERLLEADPEEDRVLKMMYTYRVHKKLTFREIATELNAQGIKNRPTKRRADIPWTYGAAARIYKNYTKLFSGVLALRGSS